jgi:hypothetical protein
MSEPDASSGEMRGFPFPGRPGRELDESLLDAFLDGQSLPPDAPEELRAVAEMLADAAGPAEPAELAGEAAARSAFARLASPAGVSPPARSARRKRSRLTVPRSSRIAAALVAAAIGLGGTAAAYAGALPSPVQDFANRMIGAPPAHRISHPTPQPARHHSRDADRAKPRSTTAISQKAHAKSPQPSRPAHPSKPPHPSKPAHPSRPPHPSKPPQPGAARPGAAAGTPRKSPPR